LIEFHRGLRWRNKRRFIVTVDSNPSFHEHDDPDDFEVALWTSMAKDKRHQAAISAKQVPWVAEVKRRFGEPLLLSFETPAQAEFDQTR
jgi:protein gp37